MVKAWRGIANIPDYGRQAAAAFDCPQVGGAPGVSGPNPQAVTGLAAMIQAGDRKVANLAAKYQGQMPDAGHAEVVAPICQGCGGRRSDAGTHRGRTRARRCLGSTGRPHAHLPPAETVRREASA